MTPFQIFGLQNTLSLVVYALLARWYVWPRLRDRTREEAVVPLLWVHAFRHIALTMVASTQFDATVPRDWLLELAYGDLLATVLALASIFAIRWKWKSALRLVWVFNIVGLANLANVFFKSVMLDVTHYHLGVGWYIATFYVPALWISHIMIFVVLIRDRAEESRA